MWIMMLFDFGVDVGSTGALTRLLWRQMVSYLRAYNVLYTVQCLLSGRRASLLLSFKLRKMSEPV